MPAPSRSRLPRARAHRGARRARTLGEEREPVRDERVERVPRARRGSRRAQLRGSGRDRRGARATWLPRRGLAGSPACGRSRRRPRRPPRRPRPRAGSRRGSRRASFCRPRRRSATSRRCAALTRGAPRRRARRARRRASARSRGPAATGGRRSDRERQVLAGWRGPRVPATAAAAGLCVGDEDRAVRRAGAHCGECVVVRRARLGDGGERRAERRPRASRSRPEAVDVEGLRQAACSPSLPTARCRARCRPRAPSA